MGLSGFKQLAGFQIHDLTTAGVSRRVVRPQRKTQSKQLRDYKYLGIKVLIKRGLMLLHFFMKLNVSAYSVVKKARKKSPVAESFSSCALSPSGGSTRRGREDSMCRNQFECEY